MVAIATGLPAFGCPDRGLLASFQVGNLPEADFDALAAHVSSCDSCAAILHELNKKSSADTVVDRLKDCLQLPTLSESPEYARMEAMAEAIDLASSAFPSSAGGPLATPLPEAMAGKRIGPYELLGAIGEGGMGVVYLARQVALDRRVALKMVLAGQHARRKALERFRIEGRAVARLNHPNIVQVYDFGEYEGLPYYSMELVDGGSLSGRLAVGPNSGGDWV